MAGSTQQRGRVAVHTWLDADAPNPLTVYVLAATVAGTAPLLLLVPVARLVRHRLGRLFFDVWEAVGILLVCSLALLEDGAHSPYLLFFFVLLAHAALAYPPAGMAIAGAGIVGGFIGVGLLTGAPADFLVARALTLVLATATCAFASYNHVRLYQRTAAYARQIAVLAARDGLTGCLNHRSFHERLQAEASATDHDHPLALILVDVDHFKAVNDGYGHPAGDRVRADLGRILVERCRPDDAPGRLGGDEFALLLPATSLAAAAAVAAALCEDIRSGRGEYDVTVSAGVAVTSLRADAAGLLAAADRELYQAKRAGRDQVCGLPGESARVARPRDGQPETAAARRQ